MNYNEALNYIISSRASALCRGFDRIKQLLEKMGNPQEDLPHYSYCRNKRKGTVAATIANTLTQHGVKAGLFSLTLGNGLQRTDSDWIMPL